MIMTPQLVVNPHRTYSYEQMNYDLDILAKHYPELFSVFSIGTSVEGRELTAFHFGKGRKKIMLVGSQHAREYITTNFIMDMVDRYAFGYRVDGFSDGYSYKKALTEATFVIVPMANPDGVNLVQNGIQSVNNPELIKNMPLNDGLHYGYRCWKANIRGVDLNRNFPILWVARGEPSSSGYAGPFSNSEPETQALVKLIQETEFVAMVSLHTQGQVIYWAEDYTAATLASIQEPYVNIIAAATGFTKMPIQEQNGEGGFMTDYVRFYKNRLALTIELCPQTQPCPYPENKYHEIARPVKNLGLILADMAKEL